MPRGRTISQDRNLLEAALEGLRVQRERIEEQIRRVQRLIGVRRGRPAVATVRPAATPAPARRQLSAAARRRIAAAQKRRWAEYRKQKGA